MLKLARSFCRFLSPLAPAAALLVLAGCAAGTDYVRPEVHTPAAYKEAGQSWKPAEPLQPDAAAAADPQAASN